MARLFIADPALTNHQGHHFSVTNSFSKFAEHRGYDVIWLVNKEFSFKAEDRTRGYRVHQTFSNATYDAYKKQVPTSFIARIESQLQYRARKLPESFKVKVRCILGYIRSVILKIKRVKPRLQAVNSEVKAVKKLTASQELYEAIGKYQTTPDDILLFHTCDAHTYADIVQLFIETIGLQDWNNFPVLHLSTPYDKLVMPHNKTSIACDQSIRYLNALGLVNSRIFLHAENELLAAYLQKQWAVEVKPLYIPQEAASVKNVEEGKFNIAYLGAARTEKGFPMVSEAIMKFLVSNDRADVSFTLQINPQIVGYTGDIQYAVKKLKAFGDSRLHLIETVQTPDEYEQTLANSNVLLLCYDKTRYAVRSSGVVIEALASAKNVIVTKGTFLEFIVAEAGISVETIDDVINAIVKFADEREHYQQLAKERAEVFLNEISPKGFSELLGTDGYDSLVFDRELLLKSRNENAEYMQLI